MNEPEWQLDVTPTADEVYESMVLAGKAIFRGKARLIAIAHVIVTGFFGPLGATLVFWLIVQAAGGGKLGALRGLTDPLTMLGFAVLGLWLSKHIYFVLAQGSVASRFGRMHQVTIDRCYASTFEKDLRILDAALRIPPLGNKVRGAGTVKLLGFLHFALLKLGGLCLGDLLSDVTHWLEAAR